MKPIHTILLSFLTLVLFTGCFCFLKKGNSYVRDLDSKTGTNLCCVQPGGSSPIIIYYGFPNTDLKGLVKDSMEAKTQGMYGLRLEHYIAPVKKIPYKFLGLGLDYSYAKIDISSKSKNAYKEEQIRNRILLNANVITLVQKRIIGYVNMQGGVELLKKTQTGTAFFPDKKQSNSKKLNLRMGYGFQYFANSNYAFLAEGGYGAGVYAKAGMSFWF